MFKFTEVAICKGSVVDNVDYNNPSSVKKSIQGDLQVLLETTTGMMLLKMKDFEYGINPNDQILYEDKDSKWKLMLCLDSDPKQVWILKVNDNVQMFFYMLSERCKLMHRRASKMIMKQAQDQNKYPQLNDPTRLKYTPETKTDQPQSTETKLIEASKSFSTFLASAGLFISQKLEAIGQFLSRKVDPSQAITVSPTTKGLIEKSVGASKKLLEFSTQKLAGVFRLATNQVVGLQSKITKTQTGKKLKDNGTIDSANNLLRVGFEAISNVYDGFMKGYDEATNGLSKGTGQVISAKYGKDAGDAALKLAQGYRNVNKLPKVANDALKRVLIETAKNAYMKQQK